MGFDLAIIGSGGAAFAAAIAASRQDNSVVMVERGTVGGTCVNTGCVPSKALLAAADARHVALSAERFPGIRAGADEVAFGELIAGKAGLVAGMQADKYVDLAAEYGWQILAGRPGSSTGPRYRSTWPRAGHGASRPSTTWWPPARRRGRRPSTGWPRWGI
jgi:mercuric reductase